MRARSVRNNNGILHGRQTRCEEKILHSLPRILTRNLFALGNLLVFEDLAD